MLTALRASLIAGLLLLPSGDHIRAAQAAGDSTGLQFLGFRPGARLEELNRQLRKVGGGPLRCRRARADRRVSECRGKVESPDLRPPIEVWISAIDSMAGVMTISGRVDSIQLETWRRTLQESYGRVELRTQGKQSMLQWVRRGRMIRLTWRWERREQVASVSLVDGRVLDGWGKSQVRAASSDSSRRAAAQPERRTR
jgi:hypothetical protein